MGKKVIIAIFLLFTTHSSDAFAQEQATSSGDVIRDRLIQRREEARSGVDSIQSELEAQSNLRRQEFRQRLLQLQDEQSQSVIDRIDNKIQVTNRSITDRFLNITEDLESILRRIELKKVELEAQGKNVTELDQSISTANDTLEEVKIAITQQASTDYIIELADGQNLREAASAVISQFRTDISRLRTSVLSLKDSILQAARLAESI